MGCCRRQIPGERGPVRHLGPRLGVCVRRRGATSHGGVVDVLQLLGNLVNDLAFAIGAARQPRQLRAHIRPPVTHDGTPPHGRARRRATAIRAAGQPVLCGPQVSGDRSAGGARRPFLPTALPPGHAAPAGRAVDTARGSNRISPPERWLNQLSNLIAMAWPFLNEGEDQHLGAALLQLTCAHGRRHIAIIHI